ncbi:hypothetical protein FB451DRAFT_1167446 [Mycena latifolia]|nr:hypothetical protein FB451DRAFT_1167446 [Mycena latifolia]
MSASSMVEVTEGGLTYYAVESGKAGMSTSGMAEATEGALTSYAVERWTCQHVNEWDSGDDRGYTDILHMKEGQHVSEQDSRDDRRCTDILHMVGRWECQRGGWWRQQRADSHPVCSGKVDMSASRKVEATEGTLTGCVVEKWDVSKQNSGGDRGHAHILCKGKVGMSASRMAKVTEGILCSSEVGMPVSGPEEATDDTLTACTSGKVDMSAVRGEKAGMSANRMAEVTAVALTPYVWGKGRDVGKQDREGNRGCTHRLEQDSRGNGRYIHRLCCGKVGMPVSRTKRQKKVHSHTMQWKGGHVREQDGGN